MNEAPQKPTLAVALTYEAPHAPRVVAVGRGATGQRIIDLAKSHGVPLSEDPLLAEALAQVELDTEIPEALYRAVAIVIGYVLSANGRLAQTAPPVSGADEVGGASLED